MLFRSIKWDVGSMQRADFVLGAMVVCLDMAFLPRKGSQDSSPAPATPTTPGVEELRYTRAQQMDSLLNCISILDEEAAVSHDAYKAVGVLRVMVDKLQKREESERANKQAASAFENKFGGINEQEQGPEHSAAMTLGMLSAGLSPNTQAFMNGSGTGMTPGREFQMDGSYGNGGGFQADEALSPFTQMFGPTNLGASGAADVPDNLDWVRSDHLPSLCSRPDANERIDGMGSLSSTEQRQCNGDRSIFCWWLYTRAGHNDPAETIAG